MDYQPIHLILLYKPLHEFQPAVEIVVEDHQTVCPGHGLKGPVFIHIWGCLGPGIGVCGGDKVHALPGEET